MGSSFGLEGPAISRVDSQAGVGVVPTGGSLKLSVG